MEIDEFCQGLQPAPAAAAGATAASAAPPTSALAERVIPRLASAIARAGQTPHALFTGLVDGTRRDLTSAWCQIPQGPPGAVPQRGAPRAARLMASLSECIFRTERIVHGGMCGHEDLTSFRRFPKPSRWQAMSRSGPFGGRAALRETPEKFGADGRKPGPVFWNPCSGQCRASPPCFGLRAGRRSKQKAACCLALFLVLDMWSHLPSSRNPRDGEATLELSMSIAWLSRLASSVLWM